MAYSTDKTGAGIVPEFFEGRDFMLPPERFVYNALRDGISELRAQKGRFVFPEQCKQTASRIARWTTTQFEPIIIPKYTYEDDYMGLTD